MARSKGIYIVIIAALVVCVAALVAYSMLTDAQQGEAQGLENAKSDGGETQQPADESAEPASANGYKVVIDVGHGGFDPGASGSSGARESDINLAIAQKLRDALLSKGFEVVMTREDDAALAEDKDGDMAARREIISTSGQDVTVSIHQNFFEDTSARGPQVFYSEGSEEGAKLAKCLQDSLNGVLEIESPRVEQDSRYYIVKSGAAPAVIVECGFLSNAEEERLLLNDEYRLAIVKAIVDGLENYLTE